MSFENKINEHGERLVWLEPRAVDRLKSLRDPRESYSYVILRLAAEGERERAARRLSGGGGQELRALGRSFFRRMRFDVRFDVGLMLRGGQHREQIGCGRVSFLAPPCASGSSRGCGFLRSSTRRSAPVVGR